MISDAGAKRIGDIRDARGLYSATETWSYFNTAAVGLASRKVAGACDALVREWATSGFDYFRAEATGENARSAVAALIGADPARDVPQENRRGIDPAFYAAEITLRRPRRTRTSRARSGPRTR